MKRESSLEDWVQEMPRVFARASDEPVTLTERLDAGFAAVRDIVGRVWPTSSPASRLVR